MKAFARRNGCAEKAWVIGNVSDASRSPAGPDLAREPDTAFEGARPSRGLELRGLQRWLVPELFATQNPGPIVDAPECAHVPIEAFT